MSETLTLTFSMGSMPPIVVAVEQALTARRPLNAMLAKVAQVTLQAHFLDRNTSEPNRHGWPRQNFWSRIRNATRVLSVSAEGATITIADPAMNQKVYGGTIRPKECKFLAIPMRAEAYGRSPKTFHDLHFVPLSGGRGLLVQNEQTAVSFGRPSKKDGSRKTKQGTRAGGGAFYLLAPSVTQAADTRALPSPETFALALGDGVSEFLGTLATRGAAA